MLVKEASTPEGDDELLLLLVKDLRFGGLGGVWMPNFPFLGELFPLRPFPASTRGIIFFQSVLEYSNPLEAKLGRVFFFCWYGMVWYGEPQDVLVLVGRPRAVLAVGRRAQHLSSPRNVE